MIHHCVRDDNSGDHYAVARSGSARAVLVQLQDRGEQVRLMMSPDQARHMAALLLAKADEAEAARP